MKKTALLALAGAAVIYILVFPCQLFVQIYPKAINLTPFYYSVALFLSAYGASAILLLRRRKKTPRLFLYVFLPLLLALGVDVFSLLYFSGGLAGFSLSGFLFSYLVSGFASVGLMAGLIELAATLYLRQKSGRPV